MSKCECGCEGEAKEGNKFINGHNSRTPEGREFARKIATKWSHSPEGKTHISQWNNSPEGQANLEKVHEEWSRSPEGRVSSIKITTAWVNSPEFKNYIKRRMASPEGKAQFEKMLKGWIGSPKFNRHIAENIKLGQIGLKKWRDSPEGKLEHKAQLEKLHEWARTPEGIAKMLKHHHPRPTDLEQRLFAVFLQYGLPFDFVGNKRQNSIGGKYPDFVHQDKNVVVEIANKKEKEFRYNIKMKKAGKEPYSPVGLYWQRYEKERIEHFTKYGYKCVVLWEDMNDEEMVWRAGTIIKYQKGMNIGV